MTNKITLLFREYLLGLSIITIIFGLIIFILGMIHYFIKDIEPDFIANLGEWNFYIVIIGFVILLIGIWYLYTYQKNRKFLLEEIKTNKRSEFLKKHIDLKNTVKHMPSKYKKMFKEKENELNIK